MASSNKQTSDPVASQLAMLQEWIQALEEDDLTMRNSNINLQKQLDLISSIYQYHGTPYQPRHPAISSNLLEAFNKVADDNPPNGNGWNNLAIYLVDQAQQVASTMSMEMMEFKEAVMSSLLGMRLPIKK